MKYAYSTFFLLPGEWFFLCCAISYAILSYPEIWNRTFQKKIYFTIQFSLVIADILSILRSDIEINVWVNISKFSKSRFTIHFAYCNSRKFSRAKIVKILIFNKKKKKKNKRFQILILRVKIFANIKIRFDYTSSINLIKINTTKRKRKK